MKQQKKKQIKRYQTDLTEKQWRILEPMIPIAREGRPRKVDIREVLNAIFYVLKSGCPWRMLPKDFPKWEIVYYYFKTWKEGDIWEQIHDALRGKVRLKARRKVEPTAGSIDSQSVKTSEKGGYVAMTLVRR